MKKYIIKIVLFFIAMFVIDYIFGYGMDYMNNNLKGGNSKQLYYGLKETKEDVLVFGSSRCYDHYVPQVITDSLHLSCYNCGYEAEGIIYHYPRIKYILNRYKPKLIIYDIEPYFDYLEGANDAYLDKLKPFAADTCISNSLKEYSYLEYLKTYSYLYRYNTIFVNVIKDFLHPTPIKFNGFQPCPVAKEGMLQKSKDYDINNTYKPDSMKLKALKSMIALCKKNGVKLVMFTSPRYLQSPTPLTDSISKLCAEEGVPYHDLLTNKYIYNNPKYFSNSGHLSEEGANVYTKFIIKWLK